MLNGGYIMNTYGKKIAVIIGILSCVMQTYTYNKVQVPFGEESEGASYYFSRKGIRYAVFLTPQEKSTVQRAVKRNYDSDSAFNKRIDQKNINSVLSSCRTDERDTCFVIENVLSDFAGQTYAELFTAIGLSRDI